VADPGISVVMPTYNRAQFIEEALDSLVRQTTPPREVLVIDDRSTDDTEVRVRMHALQSRLVYCRQPETRGASVARNTGVEMARGDTIVFLDSDDLLEPDHHETVLRILADAPDVGLVGCDCEVIGPGGKPLHPETWTNVQSRIKSYPIQTGQRSVADVFLFSTPFPGLTVRREVYRRVGGLDQRLFPLDDYDLQLKVAGSGVGVHYEHRALARYRVHGANESGPVRGVRVGEMKLACVREARARYPEVQRLGARATRRQGEVRRELAIDRLKQGQRFQGVVELAHSLLEDPGGVKALLAILGRRLDLKAAVRL
jgi:glycosyltransferase involved in cell wall biosynthesis